MDVGSGVVMNIPCREARKIQGVKGRARTQIKNDIFVREPGNGLERFYLLFIGKVGNIQAIVSAAD